MSKQRRIERGNKHIKLKDIINNIQFVAITCSCFNYAGVRETFFNAESIPMVHDYSSSQL